MASFSGKYSDLEAFITPDGRQLFFASNRPETAKDSLNDYNIWSVQRIGTTWGDPRPVAAVNTENDEFYPTVCSNGSLYLTAQREETLGGEDIYRSIYDDGRYLPPENLGPQHQLSLRRI